MGVLVEMEVTQKIVDGERPPRLSEIQGVPEQIWDMIETCWRMKPEERCDIQYVCAALPEVRTPGTGEGVSPPRPPKEVSGSRRMWKYSKALTFLGKKVRPADIPH